MNATGHITKDMNRQASTLDSKESAQTYFRDLVQIADRYGEAWPEQREAARYQYEAYIEEIGRPFKFKDEAAIVDFMGPFHESKYDEIVKALDGAKYEQLTDEELATATHAFRGIAMSNALGVDPWTNILRYGGLCRTLTPKEIRTLRKASVEEMRAIKPVSVGVRTVEQDGKSVNQYFAIIIGNQTKPFCLEDIASKEAVEKFESLIALLETNEIINAPVSVGLEGKEVRTAYREFANSFWAWYESQSKKPQAALQALKYDSMFTNGTHGETKNDQLTYTFTQALSEGKKYKKTESLTYSLDRNKYTFTCPTESPLGRLDPETSQCMALTIAALTRAIRNKEIEPAEPIQISLNEFCKRLGKYHDKSKRAYSTEDKRQILEKLQAGAQVLVSYKGVNSKGKETTLSGPYLHIDLVVEEETGGVLAPYFIQVKLAQLGRYAFEDNDYTTTYFPTLAKLNVLKGGVEELAHKIGLYIIHQYGIRATHGAKQYKQSFKVKTILQGAFAERESDSSKYLRFKEDRFESALGRLCEIGVIADWRYKDSADASLPTSRWFGAWLELNVEIDPPEVTLQRATKKHENIKALKQQNALKANRRKSKQKAS